MTQIPRAFGIVVAAIIISPTGAPAQMGPWSGSGDVRIQTIEYRNNQVVRVRTAPGFQVTIELAPDERVQNIALGDGTAFQVSANKAGNLLFVKPIQTGLTTNMSVVTDVRTYNFELSAVTESGGDLPYAIRFSYPAPPGTGPQGSPGDMPVGEMIGKYRIGGHRPLRPDAISDDGRRTYIDWSDDGPLPAVYSRDRDGRETLANGNMRGRFFVIDGVADHLVFRIDSHRAHADRLEEEGK